MARERGHIMSTWNIPNVPKRLHDLHYTVKLLKYEFLLSWVFVASAKASPPGIPNLDKVGKNYVDLSWSKPRSDGGSPIKGLYLSLQHVMLSSLNNSVVRLILCCWCSTAVDWFVFSKPIAVLICTKSRSSFDLSMNILNRIVGYIFMCFYCFCVFSVFTAIALNLMCLWCAF